MAKLWWYFKTAMAYMALGLLLLSCSSRSLNTEVTRCVFPDSPRTPAPAFVCDPQLPGYPVTQLRQSPLSDANVDERIRHVYEDQINAWSNEWASKWYRLPDTRQAAFDWLLKYLNRDARVVRSRVSPNGELWLLIGLPASEAAFQARFEKEMSIK